MKILLNMRGIRARAEKFLLPEPINLTLTVVLQEPEPEPPKKVAAPQHCWFYDNKTVLKHILESIIITGLTSLTERRQPLPMAF